MNFSALADERESRNSAAPRVEFANSLRGIAALSVLIWHFCVVFWTKPAVVANFTNSDVSVPGAIPSFARLLGGIPHFDWGAFGVALFFLISGFVIPFGIVTSSRAGFLINRVLRIYPTYFVGFAITVITLALSSHFANRGFPYSSQQIAIHFVPGLREMFGVPFIDGVVWTLEIELKFYLVCLLSIEIFRRATNRVLFVPFVILALGYSSSTTTKVNHHSWQVALQALTFAAPFISYMFIGTAIHLHYRHIASTLTAGIAGTGLISGVYLYARAGLVEGLQDALPSYVFALVVFILAYLLRKWFVTNGIIRFLADISYPLYVVHPILGYAILKTATAAHIPSGISLAIATTVAVACAFAIHNFVEVPTQNLGRRLSRRLSPESTGGVPNEARASNQQ